MLDPVPNPDFVRGEEIQQTPHQAGIFNHLRNDAAMSAGPQ